MRISELPAEHKTLLNDFIAMSRAVGARPDVIQAGGGNTSVKFGDVMAVKCSGCQLKDMKVDFGYTCLPYRDIVNIFETSDRGATSEADTSAQVNAAMLSYQDLAPKRPSVEAGFHALLGNVVIHSHAVYANIYNCIKDGARLLTELFDRHSIPCLTLPFINPGAELTFALLDQKKAFGSAMPRVIFLQNHGLVVWGDTVAEATALNDRVIDILKESLTALPKYPSVDVLPAENGACRSNNGFIIKMLNAGELSRQLIFDTPLYPDQLVYLNANMTQEGAKLELSKAGVVYYATKDAAYSFEETLLAYAYLIKVVKDNGFTLETMPESGIGFILNWDAEKYRHQMIK